MNPGIEEEGGKVATSFIDTMKSQPLALSLVVMNIMLMGLLYYIAEVSKETRRQEVSVLIDQQKEMSQLLYKCIPAETLKELQK